MTQTSTIHSLGEWCFQILQDLQLPVHYFPSTSSTNQIAKEAAMSELTPMTFYLADHQTAGRGQGTHTWLNTTPGTNLLLTCSIQSQQTPQPELCLSFGELLLEQCLKSWPHLQWKIKRPNDLLLSNKKVAGILLESVSQGPQHRLLFGLGFNVLDYPKSNDFEATSLQENLNAPLKHEEWKSFFHGFTQSLLESKMTSSLK